MLLLTEKHLDDSFFPKANRILVEIAEKNKMVCLIKNNTKFKNAPKTLQIGYIVLHHSEIVPIVFKHVSLDFFFFKKEISKLLGIYGDFYSMTPKKDKDYYVIGIKISQRRKRKEEIDCIKSLYFLENIFTKTYGK